MNSGTRKPLLQTLDKTPEYVLLNLSSGIFGLAGLVKPPNVAYAYGMGVVAGAVGSNHFQRTALLDGAVKTDHIVVANHHEAPLLVPAVDIGNGEVPAFRGGGTVDYDFSDCSHSFGTRILRIIRIRQ